MGYVKYRGKTARWRNFDALPVLVGVFTALIAVRRATPHLVTESEWKRAVTRLYNMVDHADSAAGVEAQRVLVETLLRTAGRKAGQMTVVTEADAKDLLDKYGRWLRPWGED